MLFPYLAIFMLSFGQTCLTSSEDFASEVIIPEYDLSPISSQIFRTEDSYRYQSHYTPLNLIVILSEQEEGLSLRLQMPTKLIDIEKPYLKLTSFSASKPRENLPQIYNGWKIDCNEIQCVFEKNLITITANKNPSTLTMEFNRALEICSQSCSGSCFTALKDKKCIDSRTSSDIENIMRYTNIANNLSTIFDNYRVVGSENIHLIDISPVKEAIIDWEEAMRQELVWLESQKAISLDKKDIESISLKSSRGQAGNYRIAYNQEKRIWGYYANLPDSVLTEERDCRAYNLLESSSISASPKQIFYLVPIIIALSSMLFLTILIIISRLITKKRYRK